MCKDPLRAPAAAGEVANDDVKCFTPAGCAVEQCAGAYGVFDRINAVFAAASPTSKDHRPVEELIEAAKGAALAQVRPGDGQCFAGTAEELDRGIGIAIERKFAVQRIPSRGAPDA